MVRLATVTAPASAMLPTFSSGVPITTSQEPAAVSPRAMARALPKWSPVSLVPGTFAVPWWSARSGAKAVVAASQRSNCTWPAPFAAPMVSWGAPIARWPSRSASAAPNRSPASTVPATPAVAWVMTARCTSVAGSVESALNTWTDPARAFPFTVSRAPTTTTPSSAAMLAGQRDWSVTRPAMSITCGVPGVPAASRVKMSVKAVKVGASPSVV